MVRKAYLTRSRPLARETCDLRMGDRVTTPDGRRGTIGGFSQGGQRYLVVLDVTDPEGRFKRTENEYYLGSELT